jgi:hypothetical protein
VKGGCQARADQTIIGDEGHDLDSDFDFDDEAEELQPCLALRQRNSAVTTSAPDAFGLL